MKKVLSILCLSAIANLLDAQTDSINLTSFAGVAVEQGVEIYWTTDGESGVQHFVLERSLDAISFEPVTTMAPQPNEAVKNYNCSDEGVYRAVMYYRLQTNMSAQSVYSNIIAVTRSDVENRPVITFSPTIAQTSINIIKNSTDDLTDAQVRIFNMNGILMHSQTINGDFLKLNIDISQYNAGVYMIELRKGDFASKTKFVKQHP